MSKKLICNLPNRENNEEPLCTGTVVHQISPRMIQVGRQARQRIDVVGSNWSSLVTCPKCNRQHSIVCTSGVIDEKDHHYEDLPIQPEGDPTDPNNPNNPPETVPAPAPKPAADPAVPVVPSAAA